MVLSVAFGSGPLKTLKASSPSSLASEEKQELSRIIRTVDNLYDEDKMKEALAYLERYSDSTEAEILWRLARLCHKVSLTPHTC